MSAHRSSRPQEIPVKQGDIYLIPSTGARILVVSPMVFNQATGVPIAVPITQIINPRTAGFAVKLLGTATEGAARCEMVSALHFDISKCKKLETAPEQILTEVLHRIAAIFEDSQ